MCRIRETGGDGIICAAKFNRKVFDEQGEKRHSSEVIQDAELLGSEDLNLRSRPGVKARTAHITVSAARVTFPKPQHRSPWFRQCGVSELTMNVVIAPESNPPKGASPVYWVLPASLPIESFDDAWQNPREAKAKTHVPRSWLKCRKLAQPKVALTRMTVYEFFRKLAKMGGFLGRKHDGEPGWQTVWAGFKKNAILTCRPPFGRRNLDLDLWVMTRA